MEILTDNELMESIKEIFDMTRKALNRLEADMQSEDEDIKRYAMYISKLYIYGLLELEEKLKEHQVLLND